VSIHYQTFALGRKEFHSIEPKQFYIRAFDKKNHDIKTQDQAVIKTYLRLELWDKLGLDLHTTELGLDLHSTELGLDLHSTEMGLILYLVDFH